MLKVALWGVYSLKAIPFWSVFTSEEMLSSIKLLTYITKLSSIAVPLAVTPVSPSTAASFIVKALSISPITPGFHLVSVSVPSSALQVNIQFFVKLKDNPWAIAHGTLFWAFGIFAGSKATAPSLSFEETKARTCLSLVGTNGTCVALIDR